MRGVGQLFIAYWMRDKGVGMGAKVGRITSPITGKPETIPATGFAFADTEEDKKSYKGWLRYVSLENFIGVALNLVTTIITCWLAFALPLLVAAAVLCDNWLKPTTVSRASRPTSSITTFRAHRRLHFRSLYYIFVGSSRF